MTIPITISRDAAARTILAIQGLYPPRSWRGKRGVRTFLNRVRSIQFDPINVVGRNPDLVLQSRVSDYRPELLDEMLYRDRSLFDNWDKMASISLASDWPYFNPHRKRMQDIFGVPSEVVMSNAPTILEQIREYGPQCSLDYKLDMKTDWSWGPTRVTRASLEGLFKMGKLGIHHRVRNRRYFDLIENLLPEELLNAPDPNRSLEDYQRWHVLRRIQALGLAHTNAGEQWGGIIGVKSPERRRIIQELLTAGEVLAVEVEDIPGEIFYLAQKNRRFLRQPEMPVEEKEAAFIAPLDQLLWDRKSAQRVFEFDYVWEVYKPKTARKFGYYVIPVLWGERLVARFDPEFNRESRVLRILNWWWEADFDPTPAVYPALKRCLENFLGYLNASGVELAPEITDHQGLDWVGECG